MLILTSGIFIAALMTHSFPHHFINRSLPRVGTMKLAQKRHQGD